MSLLKEHFDKIHEAVNEIHKQMTELEKEHISSGQHFTGINDIRIAMNDVELKIYQTQKGYKY